MRIGLSRIKNKQKQAWAGGMRPFQIVGAEADGPPLLQIVWRSDVARQYRARQYAKPR